MGGDEKSHGSDQAVPETLRNQLLIKSVVNKVETFKELPETNAATMTFEQLNALLADEEQQVIKACLDIKPEQYGVAANQLEIVDVPDDLVELPATTYRDIEGNKHRLAKQFLPRVVYGAYETLNQALKRDIGKQIMIDSGYRSPAYQTYLFVYFLYVQGMNFEKTIRRVAMPQTSEHCYPPMQGVDFMTEQGIPSDNLDTDPFGFQETEEYRWLLANAWKFGFELSYPVNNAEGYRFEPWHWRYVGEQILDNLF